MAHHGEPLGDGEIGELRALLDDQFRIEGTFPEGKLSKDDKGALAMGITAAKGKVVIAFPKPTDWVGFGPEQARDLCQTILDKAQECDGITARVRREAAE